MNIGKTLLGITSSFALAGAAQSALIVSEGFDYTVGDNFTPPTTTLNGGTGFAGAWNSTVPTGGTVNTHEVAGGLTFTGLVTTGGSATRDPRNGRSTINRTISAASQAALTADNSTIYFSLLMDPYANGTANTAFENNTRGTFIFGDGAASDANASGPAVFGGNGIAVAFGGSGGAAPDNATFANSNIVGATYSAGAATVVGTTGAVGDVTSMIVGQIDWAANGTADTITLYNVPDPTLGLPAAAFSTMSVDLDQSTFNTFSIAEGQMSVFDEIRFGDELIDIGVIPEPSSVALIGLAGLGLLRRRRR